MNDQYIELKPGMEVLITDPIYEFVDTHAVIGEVKIFYSRWSGHFDFELTYASDGGEYKVCYSQPTYVKVKLCRRVYVKDLCVGDVVKQGERRGIVKCKNTYEMVVILWIGKGTNDHYSIAYPDVIEDAEVVGHVDLWNL